MKKMKVAQIGVGGFGQYRRKAMRETGLFELTAACDWSQQALEQCCREEGAVPVSSYEELLSAPDIEAVIISTGAKFHAEQIIKAVERRLHVFVEKPLCAAPEEAVRILEAQKRAGVVIGVGHVDHFHDGASMTIKKFIDQGELGKIATFEKTTAHNGGLLMKPEEWRADPDKNPGGMLFQCGVHDFHELCFYFGPIAEVSCLMRYDVHTSETADVAVCHVKFDTGLIGTLNAYHVTPYERTFRIFGTKANLHYENRFFDEGVSVMKQQTRLDSGYEPRTPVEIKEPTDDCGNLRSFYKAVREGSEPYPSVIDGARAVAAVFAAEESARTGRSVRVERYETG
jgi:predicted dehydrogenase